MSENLLQLVKNETVFISVIPSSYTHHPSLTNLVGVYVNVVEKGISGIIPVDHPEKMCTISIQEIYEELKKTKKLFCVDKKYTYHFLPLKNLKDLKILHNNISSTDNPYINWIQTRFKDDKELTKIIPLIKLLEKYDNEFNKVRDYIESFEPNDGFNFINDIATPVFYLIEKHGLKITYQSFLNIFKPGNPDLNIKDNITYTSYNLYNITTRPTNSFNGINYAAIPKKEEYRKCFIPQNDLFVEFDFDGYHIRLLAEQVGFKLTSESAHKQLARHYFNKEEISSEEYTQAKQINFQALYGHTPEEQRDFKLFKMIESWTQDLWRQYSTNGYVIAPISNKRFTNDIEGMYPKKLLNYIIQALETARNISVLKNALEYLNGKKTKIALYTYDSVLIDFAKEDGKETLEELENILSERKKYPVKFKHSLNLFFD